MGLSCQCSAVAAGMMVVLVVGAAIATLTSVILAQTPLTPGQNCYRKCEEGDYRVCYFNFDVTPYQTMSRACYDCPNNVTDCFRPHCVTGDGVTRKIFVVNKQMPGPPIQVCKNDLVVVNVKNSLITEGLTIHWHGITMRGPDGSPFYGTPYMDGTPGITQCPIQAGATFKYSFVARESGTHFYHAHSGLHRGDGVYGPIVVRQPLEDDPNHYTYDYDLPYHTLLIHDWLHIPTEDKYLFRHHIGADDFPESMLINGRGSYQHAVSGTAPASIPYSRFKVSPGKRYRFRIISNAILNCPIVMSVEDHHLNVIASDGNPIVPVNASSLVIYAGERWDVVIETSRHKSGLFWMSFMGGVDCEPTQAHQFALLHYDDHKGHGGGRYFKGTTTTSGAQQGSNAIYTDISGLIARKPGYSIAVPPNRLQINTINRACLPDLMCVADLRSPYPLPRSAKREKAHYTFYLAFEMNKIHNPHFYSRRYYNFFDMPEEQQISTPQINNITFELPVTPLLMGGGENFCNIESPPKGRSCSEDFCQCTHMYSVPLGALVDLVFIDEGKYGDENHPIHLHGQHFWVLAQDRPNDVEGASITREEVISMDVAGLIERNLDNPPLKDTVTIADGGYTVVRFLATNPGYWLLHCHLQFHSAAGMDLVIKIGEDYQMPQIPYGFPTCGDYKGSVGLY